jgi:PKD repeat protein
VAVLGLPAVDLTQFDPIAETAAGNPDGPAFLAVHAKVAIAYVEMSRLLLAASNLPLSQVSAAVMSGIAGELVTVRSVVDLSDGPTLARIIGRADIMLQAGLTAEAIGTAAGVIAAAGQAIDDIDATGGVAYLEAIARIEWTSQGGVAADLARYASGEVTATELVAENTGAALAARIEEAPVGLILSPEGEGPILGGLFATDVVEGGNLTLLGSIEETTGQEALALLIDWGDGVGLRIALEPGATTFQIDHAVADDDPSGTANDGLPVGVLLFVDNEARDARWVTATAHNAAPQLTNVVHTPSIIAGATVSLSGDVFDRGSLDTFTLTIDWGDGQADQQVVEQGAGTVVGSHRYAGVGSYAITVGVGDDDDGTTQETLSVAVREAAPASLEDVQIDDDSGQRSMIRGFTLVFDQPVTVDPTRAILERSDGTLFTIVLQHASGDGSVFGLSVVGAGTEGGSLPEGDYRLTIEPGFAVNGLGQEIDVRPPIEFVRRFGDADGDGDVDTADWTRFAETFGLGVFAPGYLSFFDFNGDEVIDALDASAMPNVAPAVDLTAPVSGVRGQGLSFAGTFTDPGILDTHAVAWDFGDGTTVAFHPATDAGALTPAHTFEQVGTYTVTLSVRDDDGGTGVATGTVVVQAVALLPDPCDPGRLALFVAGTSGDDKIRIVPADLPGSEKPACGEKGRDHNREHKDDDPGYERAYRDEREYDAAHGRGHDQDEDDDDDRDDNRNRDDDHRAKGVEVWINGVSQGVFAHTGRIIVLGLAGDDDIAIAGSLKNAVEFQGGDGDDRLKAGVGSALLLGGAGDDELIGGSSADVLIGGTGKDRLVGGPGDDLLIAGSTIYDDDPQALCTIFHEWTDDTYYGTRVGRLTRGVDGVRLTDATVLDDGVEDTLTGAAGMDWFFATVEGHRRDKVTDRQCGETLTALPPIAPAPNPCKPVIDWNWDDDRHDDPRHPWDHRGHRDGWDDPSTGSGQGGPGGWVKAFVLDLGAHDPNRDIQVTLAGPDQAYASANGPNGHGSRRHW